MYHITGTDIGEFHPCQTLIRRNPICAGLGAHLIVRALSFRFEAFGRPVKATKKWEEGVFSDLRNLKPGLDASLEEPK